jgi:hypothetical protein
VKLFFFPNLSELPENELSVHDGSHEVLVVDVAVRVFVTGQKLLNLKKKKKKKNELYPETMIWQF